MNVGLPTPPSEESHHHSSKKSHPSSRVANQVRRGSGKQIERHTRVWKACEWCRKRKSKCDDGVPCKRCKDNGRFCLKEPPKGCAGFESTQSAMIATIRKLYDMVRNGQSWDLDEPRLNDQGQPVVHDIVDCILLNNGPDQSIHSVFPEDHAGMAGLATQLKEAQHPEQHEAGADSSQSQPNSVKWEATDAHTVRSSSSVSDLEHFDSENDDREASFGGGNGSMKTQSVPYHDFGTGSTNSISQSGGFTSQSPMQTTFGKAAWANQDWFVGTFVPDVSSCPNFVAMPGMGDPIRM